MTVVMVMASTDRFRQILHIGELAAARRVVKVGGKLVELVGRGCISLRLGGLGGDLEVGSDLLRDLLILRRVGLLQLLERGQHLGKRRKTALVL